jgi:hypothetical protein
MFSPSIDSVRWANLTATSADESWWAALAHSISRTVIVYASKMSCYFPSIMVISTPAFVLLLDFFYCK